MPAYKKSCDIVLLVDAETGAWNRRNQFVPARGSVEAHVLRALRQLYSRQLSRHLVVVPFSSDWMTTVRTLHRLAPKLVFNLTEWINGDRSLDHIITSLLDALALPYTGSGARGLQLCRDKVACKRIVAELGVAVPEAFDVRASRHFAALPFPLLVKPRYGDGSDAISKAALVQTPAQLRQRLAVLQRKKLEPLCEAFVAGRDIYVGLLGGDGEDDKSMPPRVLPAIEMVAPSVMDFATDNVKVNAGYRRRHGIHFRQTTDRKLNARLRAVSAGIFQALALRDYARLDFRLRPDGTLVFIEANPNPDLAPHTFGANLCFAGVDYASLIRAIVRSARRRAAMQ